MANGTGVLPFGRGATSSPTLSPVGGGAGALPFSAGGAPAPAAGSIPIDTVPGGHKKGNSLFHNVVHATAHDLGLAAHDVKTIPGGLLKVGTDFAKGPGLAAVGKQWEDLILHGKLDVDPNDTFTRKDVPGILKSTKESIEHPLRDPFQTLLTILPAAAAGAKIGIAAGEGAIGADAGSTLATRVLKTGDDGATTPLHGSTSPAIRLIQAGHDKLVQKAIDTRPDSRLASYGNRRIGYSKAETQRYQVQLRDVVANRIEGSAKSLAAEAKAAGVPVQAVHDALRLTSENDLAENAAQFHEGQAAQGIEPEANTAAAARMRAVGEHGLVIDQGGKLVINAEKFPKLAEVDSKIAEAQKGVDAVALRHMGISAEQLKARIDAPNRYRAGGHFVEKGEAANEAQWARQSGTAASRSILRDAARAVRLAKSEGRDFHAQAEKASNEAFNLRTRLTPQEREAQSTAKVTDTAAEKASSVRFKTAPAAEKAQNLRGLLDRQQRLHQLQTERFQRGEIGEGKLFRSQKRLQGLTDKYEQVADAGFAHKQASADTQHLVQLQEIHGSAIRGANGGAEAAAAAAEARAAHLTSLGTEAFSEADRIKAQAIQRAQAITDQAEHGATAHLATAHKIIGGEGAREGRSFVSHQGTEATKGSAPIAATVGPVVGDIRKFISGKRFRGLSLQEGKIPTDTLHMVAKHIRDAVRYVNTDAFRRSVLETGAATRRSQRDVLVKIPDEAAGEIDTATRVELGQVKLTTEEAVGEAQGFDAWLQNMIPSLLDRTIENEAIGAAAPQGYKWVDRNVLGDLARPVSGAPGAFARKVNDANAIITAMTVYFKLGHVGTRYLTNASANIIQGSAHPAEIMKSADLWKALSQHDRDRAFAVVGQKSFEALPAEGMSHAARAARWGSKRWAKYADSPFRFSSIAYEARKAGFDTPEKFRDMLDKMENPHDHNLNAAEHARIDWVAKRADRAAIAYDRLNVTEKKYLARGIWFYPWVKGSTSFALHVLTEHPYQAAVYGALGVEGRKHQFSLLGDLPEYEQGLIPLGGGSHPTVTDFSTFSPFATPAELVQAVANPSSGELAGMASPVLGALDSIAHGTDQYGNKSKNPLGDAASQLLSPTPEAQILTPLLHPGQNRPDRMFQHTWQEALKRALISPAAPRRINRSAANKSAARDRSGR